MLSRGQIVELAEAILAAAPGQLGGSSVDQCFGNLALRWLAGEVPIRGRSLSTGFGRATALAMAASAEHTTVATDVTPQHELERWCTAHDVATAATCIARADPDQWSDAPSDGSLDLLIVNGAQEFPRPIVDWHRLAPKLSVGGLLVLADASRRPTALLADYLHTGSGAWERRLQATGVAVFAKVEAAAPDGARGARWTRQRPTLDALLTTARHRRSKGEGTKR